VRRSLKKIKAAVIGTGFIGPAHIEALYRIGGVEVTAVTSGDDPGARSISDKFSIPSVYNTWQEVIEDNDVEVIHNCTPNHLHFEINKAAIEAGKHIISEKPLTISSKESAELLRLAENNKVLTAVNYNYRFYPLIQHARSMVESKEIGEIYYIHGNYLQDWLYYDTDYNWRLESKLSGSSRAIADIGTHWCDLMQFISGKKIVRVYADLLTIHKKRKKPLQQIETFKTKEETPPASDEVDIDTEDIGTVILEFENNTRGVFTVSQVSAGRKNHFWFEIDGSKKSVSWNQEEPNSLWIGSRDKANEILIKDPSLLNENARRYAHYPGGHPEGYPDGPKNLFINFYNYLRSGKTPQLTGMDFPTFLDGHRENLVVEAVLKSNNTRTWVEVKEGA
jgi:predicted dehydrogenase